MGRWLHLPRRILSVEEAATIPAIESVSPTEIELDVVDYEITVTGTGFLDGAAASFSSTGITVNSTTWVSSTELTVNLTVAADAEATVRDLTVTNPNGIAATMDEAFGVQDDAIVAPAIVSIAPEEGEQGADALLVTVTGSGFGVGVAVTFSGTGITVNSTTRENANKLTVSIDLAVDATLSARDVVATNPNEEEDTLAASFTVEAA